MACAFSRPGRFRQDGSGSVAVITALVFPILIGGMALGAEASFWYLSQRKLQQIGDLAVYAAAVQKRSGRDETAMHGAAVTAAHASGLDAGADELTLHPSPVSGAFAGRDDAVEVRLVRQQERYFSLIYSDRPVTMSARAVAQIREGADACVLALDPSGGGAITVSGSSSITFDGCDVAANSAAKDAFDMQGGRAELTTGCVSTVGGADITSNLTMRDCASPRTEAPAVRDPYADVPEPPTGLTCERQAKVGSGNGVPRVVPTTQLPDGTKVKCYQGGPSIKGDVTFDPGLYVIEGGTLSINANSRVFGEGVTFHLRGGASLAFNGGASIDLTAPATGPYAGLLFFGSRDDSGVDHTINGSAGSRLAGAVYLPSGSLGYSGNFTGSGGCTQIVARRVEFTGNSTLDVDCTAAGTRRIAVRQTIALVE